MWSDMFSEVADSQPSVACRNSWNVCSRLSSASSSQTETCTGSPRWISRKYRTWHSAVKVEPPRSFM